MSSYDTKLRLIVRSFTDQNPVETPGAKTQSLMAGDTVQDAPPPPAWEDPASAPAFQPAAARAFRRGAPANDEYDAPAPRQQAAAPVAPVAPTPKPETVPVYNGSKKADIAFPK
jgi:hypothetical protein